MSHYQCTKCICFAYVNIEINYKPSLSAGHRRGIAFLRIQGAKLGGACNSLPSNLWNEMHQIAKLKCFLSRLEVVFAESIEDGVKSRMKMLLEQRRQTMPQSHLSDQQFLLPTKVWLISDILR